MKIFLSHSTKDKQFVQTFAAELKAEKIEPWICEVDVEFGGNFVAKIEEGLRDADLTILFWSPEAARSDWTRLEWTSVTAREISESRTRLGIVLLRDCEVPELLRVKHRIDARTDPEQGRHETIDWIKRLRDMRRLAETRAPGVFLPPPPHDFVGRAEDLEMLYAALKEDPGSALLHGEPGCGKSTLALKFAWQTQGAFDAVVFQVCGQRPVTEIAAELSTKLELGVEARPPEEQIAAAKKWLTRRRALLVLDDIRENDVKALVPGPPASLLCTSRRRSLPWISRAHSLEVTSFSRAEAESIFRIYLGDETVKKHRDALLEFAERVERLPIAIVVGADMLRWELDPVPEAARGLCLERLRNEVHDVPELLRRAIAARPQAQRRLLFAMAVCTLEGFWFPLAVEIAGLGEAEGRDARNRLVYASLLRVLDRDRQRFQLHALLREELRNLAPLGELQAAHAEALESLYSDWERRWCECRECLPEVIPAVQYLHRVVRLSSLGSEIACRIGELEIALRIIEQAEALCLEFGDKNGLQGCYGNRAIILEAWGRLEEAMALHKKEEALCLELNTKDGLQGCYGNQAAIMRARGQLREALTLLEKQEALCLELGNKNDLQGCYGNQAVILKDWGRVQEALTLLQEQEALCLELGNKNGLMECYGNRATILQTLGRLKEAMALHKKEEALCLELGNKHGLQISYGNQALILGDWGRLEEAMALLEKQEGLCLELDNKDGLQMSYGNQALILQTWGRLQEALTLLEKGETLSLELGNKVALQMSYGNQAVILQAWGRLKEAFELHKKEEALCLELGNRSGLAYCYWNWGLLSRKQRDRKTELEKLAAALVIFTDLKMPRERDSVRAELEKTTGADRAT
jgi:tetratricopeptide (TPR) repeat protein